MIRSLLSVVAGLTILVTPIAADVRGCVCDVHDEASMKRRECSLCGVAERHEGTDEFFVLKDVSPHKPNRWLVLPKRHTDGAHNLHLLPNAERTRLWRYAIAQARERFGDADWGVAYNSEKVRTQCHLHIHLGRFIRAAENSRFRLVKHIEQFPNPAEGGVFVHPVAGGFHVHTGEDIMETALVR